MEETYTVSQAAKIIGIAPNTIRAYTRDFADHLSDGAKPPPGDERLYTDEDIRVFNTVRVLRKQRKKAPAIESALNSGQRLEPPIDVTPTPVDSRPEPPKADKPTPDTQGSQESALATLELLQRFAKPYMDRVSDLEEQIDEERDARLKAEVDAARLTGQLDSVYRRHWYQFWRPERPQDDD